MPFREIMPDDFNHMIPEIIISPRPLNANGLPYASSVNHTHSSDLRTWQEVFHAAPVSQGCRQSDRSL